jgi:hypothetical protein
MKKPQQSVRVSALDDIGNPDAPPGSQPWARWFVDRAKKRRNDMKSDAKALVEIIDELDQFEAWRPLGYASAGMLYELEVGLLPEELDRLRKAKAGDTVEVALAKRGRPKKGEEKGDAITLKRGSTGGPYLVARLARDFPEIKARLDAGEFKSVRAAALEAGIVVPSFLCPDDPVKAARRIKKRFQGDALRIFQAELKKPAGHGGK